ncbi:MAG: DUF4255 domain-containing protein [Acidimicrobiia bacterium]
MLHHLDESLELFLRACVPLGVRDIDVAFDAPDRTWAGTISRPTVNLFLYDVQRSVTRAVAGRESVEVNGTTVQRMAPMFVDCRYLATAWTAERRDEHRLLGALLATVVSYREIPPEHLVGAIAELRPIPRLNLASVAQRDQQHAQLWPALEGQLHPALDLIVTVPVESTLSIPVGPPVTGVELATSSTAADHHGTRRVVAGRTEPPAPGAMVRSPRGMATANGSGHFLVPAETGDEVVLDAAPERRVTVPEAGGVEL